MDYYTERNGMRKAIEKTYTIDPEKYAVLFDCCEKYFDNIAWKYSEICKSIYGLDAFGYVIDFIKCCQMESIDTVLTVLDFIDQADIDSCKIIAEKYNASFRIRGMVQIISPFSL